MNAVLAPRPLVMLNQTGAEADVLVGSAGLPVALAADSDTPPWLRAHDVDVLFTGPRNGWRNAPATAPAGWPGRLQWVHVASAGIDFFPPWLLQVPQVTCSRGVAAVPIAEYVLTALLSHQRGWDALRVAGAGPWRETFARVDQHLPGTLQGRALGVAGYGAIGREVARLARAFGVRVTVLRRGVALVEEGGSHGGGHGEIGRVHTVDSIEKLLAASDHLVLALPITAQTYHLINAAPLAHARPGLHLVNIARGALVDQQALLHALDDGRLSGATLDVTDPEPLPEGHPLYCHPRVRLTPHVSWAAQGAAELTARKFMANLARHVAGQPLEDVVDAARGY
ncbi:NAD(P)-dependent oxidoreductase [Acidovorax sp. sic0104]|uniref:NAD(P)-dependent oxidoreductase n=1 Tax=Acidovorax sp. sic0104 TaxID=2854784 RepID=UPI001C473650|nr:NAD(P)-dependent oxidoreductase [Acidovorax sp. sic0104]MBV7540832.1 dihydrofolate reductase [Acidovorax sp. sic0104]